MAEHTKGQDPNRGRTSEESKGSSSNTRVNVGHQGSQDRSGSSGLDEKSSTMGRREKGTGLATKDGLTGSDLDGQVTD